jgi:GNAT superfamily N-acetyltransferase
MNSTVSGASVEGLKIRRVNPAAYAGECDATGALFLAARAAMLPHLAPQHSEDDTCRWMREIVFPRLSVWLAEAAGEIVGFAARDGAWLAHLYVKPGWTGKGIGSHLLEVICAEAARVSPVLRLYTFARNTGARRFYERHGFAVTAQSDGSGNEEREPDLRYERAVR